MSTRAGKKFIGAYIPAPVKKRLEQIAKTQDRSLSYVVEKILDEGVKHQAQEPQAKAA